MNPLDISALPFPGGTVDASTFQLAQGPTSRSVPWTDPLVDVVFPALATASRLAVLVEQHETLTQDAIPAARDDGDAEQVAWLELRAKAVAARLRELGASDLLYLRWLEREAPTAIQDGLRALEPCGWCYDEGTNEGRFCDECLLGRKMFREEYDRHAWMAGYARQANAMTRLGDHESAEAIRKACCS